MLHWEIDKGVICKLFWNEQNIIAPWGIETADSHAFFSQEEGIGYRYTLISKEEELNTHTHKTHLCVQMHEGKWTLETLERIENENTLTRSATLTCLEDTWAMDFVMRFRFLKSFVGKAHIAGRSYEHLNTNTYYQFPVTEAQLSGDGLVINIKADHMNYPDKILRPHFYVRDRDNEWIVHARMLPINHKREIIKLCNSWCGTRSLPQALSNQILNNPQIKSALWYHNEQAPYQSTLLRLVNPNAFALALLPKGTKLNWSLTCQIK